MRSTPKKLNKMNFCKQGPLKSALKKEVKQIQ